MIRISIPRLFLTGLEYTDFNTVIDEADFLSMHCILTGETRGIINRAVMKRMKNNALLVNTARGALINEKDLIWALQENEIGGAALDVFTDEPLTKGHPLFSFANVILTPHFAFYSWEAYARLERECYEALVICWLANFPKYGKNDLIKNMVVPQDLHVMMRVNRYNLWSCCNRRSPCSWGVAC